MTTTPDNPRALSADGELHSDGKLIWQQSGPDRKSDWPTSPDPDVVKLVLGERDKQSEAKPWQPVLDILTSDLGLKHHFPHLTHLHLWGLPMEKLGPLPDGLKVLDVRKCPALHSVPDVPGRELDTLVLEDCPNLATVLPLCGNLDGLRDLSFKNCPALPESVIQSHLNRAPLPQKFDASGCVKLTLIESWPASLVDVRLAGCPGLRGIPDWPNNLRRLQLRGSSIKELDNFPASLDYIDLGGMRNLSALPTDWGKPRTLFLFGSGILMPPASEHGENHDENVAKRTRAYFDDVELTGVGDVKRCKLLVLGNGSAGKTCFSLNLVGENPRRTCKDYEPKEERLGTTHGVQFHDWRPTIPLGGKSKPVHLHVWDFGGQEIYHNTHRLFMGTGAVFVVLWNPDQVGKEPDPDASGHQDNWRPLRYWLDYIRLACPHAAQIAIVCSGGSKRTPEEIERLLAEDSGDPNIREQHPVFFIDSVQQLGQIDDFKVWLRDRVAGIVTTQGSAVPSYWEIAQDLVESWVKRFHSDPKFAAAYQRIDAEAFGSLLEDEIKRRTQTGTESRFKKLADAVLAERPFMTEDRIRRTLAFLTHSGWIFWHPSLTGGKAIIGQKWALDGIYTLLQRVDGEEPSNVYLRLRDRKGRFTIRDLERWGWDSDVPEEQDRELLISFMERIGLCVRLVKREELIHGEPEYLSLSHLVRRADGELERRWKRIIAATPADLAGESIGSNTQIIENELLHQGHWDQILGSLADRFGTDAQYARDGFFATNTEGQHVLITADLENDSLGGRIMVDVIGSGASELETTIANTISAFVKGQIGRTKVDGDIAQATGERDRVTTVFFSYTWQPRADNTPGREIPGGYETPVDVLYEALDKLRPAIVPVRDKFLIKEGDSITEHNQRIRTCDKVILVHSDKYWKSPFCMDEFTMLLQSLLRRPDTIQSVLTVIEHHQKGFDRSDKPSRGPFKDGHAKKLVDDFWEAFDEGGLHPMLEQHTTARKLKAAVLNLVRNEISMISDISAIHLQWDDAKATRIVDQVIRRVNERSPAPEGNA